MHSKSGKTVTANTKQEHLDLKEKGYGHTPSPAKQKQKPKNPTRKIPLQYRGIQYNTSKEKQRQSAIQKANAKGRTSSPTKLKDACYRKVKAQYDVFPSAYASGAIAKCRKKNK